jgi:3-deoxy-D-manno-octulosonate 8-phosphate phosphatase (KDO 8-P phosphatase)
MSKPAAIALFGMDVDGVLTDGGIYYGGSGLELKRFNVQDGMGITLVRRADIVPFIITARRSSAVARRALELGIEDIYQGARNKSVCLEELASKHGVPLERIAFVGDDLSDLSVLTKVGLPIAVANAIEEVKEVAKYVTSRSGGDGAVREACEYVIRANGYEGSMHSLLE